MSTKRDEIMRNLHKQAERIDRNEEYRSKRTYEKKSKAVRRFEKYANMGDDDKKKSWQ